MIDYYLFLLLLKTLSNDKRTIDASVTLYYKILVVVFVLLPKLYIGILFFLYGGRFLILSASDQELLLNVVALVFILEIDEFIFLMACSEETREVMVDLPGLEVDRQKYGQHHGYNFFRYVVQGVLGKCLLAILFVIVIAVGPNGIQWNPVPR